MIERALLVLGAIGAFVFMWLVVEASAFDLALISTMEQMSNPFVRVWRGADPEGTTPCRVGGRDARLVVWSPDYDGKGKAWVRYEDGEDAIVGGSSVERNGGSSSA